MIRVVNRAFPTRSGFGFDVEKSSDFNRAGRPSKIKIFRDKVFAIAEIKQREHFVQILLLLTGVTVEG